MIRSARHDGRGPEELFVKHDLGQFVGHGQGAQAELELGPVQELRRQAQRSADDEAAFPDGIFEARTIQSLSSRPVLHAKSPPEGFVVAAELDVPFAVDGKWIGEPFYSVSEEPVTCPVGDCFYLGKEPPEATGWGLVQTSHAPIVLDESFFLFRKLN